jgi:hypothetical protein
MPLLLHHPGQAVNDDIEKTADAQTEQPGNGSQAAQ